MALTGALALLAALSGCLHAAEEIPIEPDPATARSEDLGLGPGVRALTAGPGFKSSPSVGPDGERVAFIVDGYVADRALGGGETRRLTTTDLDAESVEWASGETLSILDVADEPSEEAGIVYVSDAADASLQVRQASEGALAMTPVAGGVLVALRDSGGESRLSFVAASGEERVVADGIEGTVTGLSVSPDGETALLAVRGAGASHELRAVDLASGSHARLAETRRRIIGAPQWTTEGVFFVAGEEEPGEAGAALFDLYRIPRGSERVEPAPGVGEDFVASGLEASPDGERIAVIGRLSPNSPSNLYLLDPAARELEALTSNEDMEIKAGSDDLDWSPDGSSVVIVARTQVSGAEVRNGPADSLRSEFYNLYEVPVEREERPG